MVRNILKSNRPAVAMIELIFSLVIMGIVMMSAPMLISTSQTSTSIALQQEGINEAVSRVNMIMGYAWDENNTNSAYAPILHTSTAGHPDLAMVPNRARRAGTPLESQRTFIFADIASSDLNASTTLGLDAGETDLTEDDIDDFSGTIGLTLIDAATIDYVEKNKVSIITSINYNSDSVVGGYNQSIIEFNPFATPLGTTNIKSIVVTLRSTDSNNSELLDKEITFRAFSSNIGTYILEERTF